MNPYGDVTLHIAPTGRCGFKQYLYRVKYSGVLRRGDWSISMAQHPSRLEFSSNLLRIYTIPPCNYTSKTTHTVVSAPSLHDIKIVHQQLQLRTISPFRLRLEHRLSWQTCFTIFLITSWQWRVIPSYQTTNTLSTHSSIND